MRRLLLLPVLLWGMLGCGSETPRPNPTDLPTQAWFDSLGKLATGSRTGALSFRDDKGTVIKKFDSGTGDTLQVLLLAGKRHVLVRKTSETRILDQSGILPDTVLPPMGEIVAGLFIFPGEAWLMGTDGTIQRWEVGVQRERITIGFAGENPTLAQALFTEQGEWVFTLATQSAVVRIWNRVTGQLIGSLSDPDGHKRPVTTFDIAPDGSKAVTAGQDNQWILWDINNLSVSMGISKPVSSTVQSIALAPNGNTVCTGHADGTVKLWGSYVSAIPFYAQYRQWYEWRSFYGHQGPVAHVDINPFGDHVLSVGSDQTVRMWNSSPDQIRPIYRPAEQLDIASGGSRLLTTETNGKVYVWDVPSFLSATVPQPLVVLTSAHMRGYTDASMHPSGNWVAASTWSARGDREESKLDLWDISNPNQPRLARTVRNTYAIDFDQIFRTYIGSVFSPDGRYLLQQETTALTDCTNLNIWDVEQMGNQPSSVPLTRSSCTFLEWKTFSPNSQYVVGSRVLFDPSYSFRIWETQPPGSFLLKSTVADPTLPLLANFSKEVFSRDGSRLFSIDVRSELNMWDLSDVGAPKLVRTFPEGSIDRFGRITSMESVSPGKLLLHNSNLSISGINYWMDETTLRHLASAAIVFPDTGSSSTGSSRSKALPDGSGVLTLYNQAVDQLYFWPTPALDPLLVLDGNML